MFLFNLKHGFADFPDQKMSLLQLLMSVLVLEMFTQQKAAMKCLVPKDQDPKM